MIQDVHPGSGTWFFPLFRIQGSKRHQIRIRNAATGTTIFTATYSMIRICIKLQVYVFRSGLRGIFWNKRHEYLYSGHPSLAGEKERRRRERDARRLHSSTWQPTPWHLAQTTLRSAYFYESRTFSKSLDRFANPEFIISIVYFKKSVF
jgi:hypothetical protein